MGHQPICQRNVTIWLPNSNQPHGAVPRLYDWPYYWRILGYRLSYGRIWQLSGDTSTSWWWCWKWVSRVVVLRVTLCLNCLISKPEFLEKGMSHSLLASHLDNLYILYYLYYSISFWIIEKHNCVILCGPDCFHFYYCPDNYVVWSKI